ncbi:hypothetical protein [Pseudomonas aeruginosa]|uniref:hypothetical protein n=1 Tax=Pseudomonas aeruginosa TaxID=287 RepID=UPI002576A14C|nr:hypothetical protein [Pseudomonas aeruginosa]MDM1441630.1 hypothetical protein [Pseudomonas aeruginosa]
MDIQKEQIIGNSSEGMRTRSSFKESNLALFSQIEPKSYLEALKDECWISAMKEELKQFEKNEVWSLVPRINDNMAI